MYVRVVVGMVWGLDGLRHGWALVWQWAVSRHLDIAIN